MEIIRHISKQNILYFKQQETIYKIKFLKYLPKTNTLECYLFNTNTIINLPLSNKKAKPKTTVENSFQNKIISPLSGRVIAIHVSKDQYVAVNQPLVTIESMKMENEIRAHANLFIKNIFITQGHLVKQNEELMTVTKIEKKGSSNETTNYQHVEKKVSNRRTG